MSSELFANYIVKTSLLINSRPDERDHPKSDAHTTLMSTKTAHSPKTSPPVLLVVILRAPAMAASPIESRIKYQMLKMSSELAIAIMIGDESEGRKAPTFVGTMPLDFVGSMPARLSLSCNSRAMIVTIVAIRAVTAPLQATTE